MASKNLGTLTLSLVAQVGGFVQGMDKAERSSAKWQKQVKRNMDQAGKAIKQVATIASAALVGAFGAVVVASAKQEAALKQVEQRLKSTGNAVGKTASELATLASDLQAATTFGDEDILQAQSLLLTFTGIAGETFDRTLMSVLNLSTAMDTDLKSSVVQLGKALNDPIANLSALSRSGIQFSEQQKSLIKSLVETGRLSEAQAVILTELERQFGGAATAAADTFGGALKQVQNAFGDLLENPAGLEANKDALQELTAFLQDPGTIQAAQDLTSALISGFRSVGETIKDTLGTVRFLAEEFAAIRSGAAADDLVRLDEQLAKTKSALENPTERIRFFGPGGAVEYWDEDELKSEIKRLESAISAEQERLGKSLLPVPIVSSSSVNTVVSPTLDNSEEFKKREAALRKEVDLYGVVSKTAQLRYEIENGLIKGLLEGEGEKLIALQQELEAREKAADLIEEQNKAIDDLSGKYEEQIALTGEVTELERVRYEIAKGALVGINAEQQNRLEGLAAEVDAIKAAEEAEKERGDLQKEISSLTSGLRTAEEVAIDNYIESMSLLNQAQAEGIVILGGYDEAARRTFERYNADLEKANENTDKMSVFAEQAARNMQDAFADFLFDPFEDGLDGMLDNFAKILQRMAAEAAAAQIFDSIGLGGSSGSSGSGGGSDGFDWGQVASFFGGFFAEGGRPDPNKISVIGERGAELFVPDGVKGTVVPMDNVNMSGARQDRVSNSNFTFGDFVFPGITNAREARQAEGAMQRSVARAVSSSQRYA